MSWSYRWIKITNVKESEVRKMKYLHGKWYPTLLRFIRVALAAGVAQAVLVRPDWSNPEQATTVLVTAFVAGLISAIFKYLREKEITPERLPL